MSSDPLLSFLSYPYPASLSDSLSFPLLKPGTKFTGYQSSSSNNYPVSITIDYVNLVTGELDGLLEIEGLVAGAGRTMKTVWKGELVGFGENGGWVTNNYGSSIDDDWVHWNKFDRFKELGIERDGLKDKWDGSEREFVFLRLKETCVLDDEDEENINGASFAGFYFLCLDLHPPQPTPVGRTRRPASTTARSSSTIHRSQSVGTTAPPPPAPTRPRSESRLSQGVSYAAILRRDSTSSQTSPDVPSSPSLSSDDSSSSSSSDTSSVIDSESEDTESEGTATPLEPAAPPASESKEYDPSFLPTSIPIYSPLPALPTSPLMVSMPLPPDTTESDFPPPSSPPLGRGRRGFSFGAYKEERGRKEREEVRKGNGGQWGEAKMTGWYFFNHSEPFQQLSLSYVAQVGPGGGIGSETFQFR